MITTSASIAIVIVNFRRALDTIECLESLSQVSSPLFHIYLVDNGSGNQDIILLHNYIAQHPERITLTIFPENYGFTGAHNRIFEQIIDNNSHKFILLLNNDTVVDSNFLSKMLVKIDREQRIEMVAARMMKYYDRKLIDNLGITFYKSGLASNRKSLDEPLLGPCGGCALYTIELLQTIRTITGEYFDNDFFCYAEDTDLAWRAVFLGYRTAYADQALVYHKGSITSGGPNSDFVLYYGIRNSLFVLIKNIPLKLLLLNSGWIFLLHLAIFTRYLLKGKSLIILKIYRDFIYKILIIIQKRHYLQKRIKISSKSAKQFISTSFYERGYIITALSELIKL